MSCDQKASADSLPREEDGKKKSSKSNCKGIYLKNTWNSYQNLDGQVLTRALCFYSNTS